MCIHRFIESKQDPKKGEISGSRTHTPDGIPIPNGSRSNWDFLLGRSPAVGQTDFPVNIIGARRKARRQVEPEVNLISVMAHPQIIWVSIVINSKDGLLMIREMHITNINLT